MRTSLTLLIISCTLFGCKTNCLIDIGAPPYFINRARDLTDFAHVDFHRISVGVATNLGPSILGMHSIYGIPGAGDRYKIGFGGAELVNSSIGYIGFFYPIMHAKENVRSKLKYGEIAPAFGSIGFDFGFGFGLGARIDIIEFVDFLVGFTTIDILLDDTGLINEEI